MSRAVELMEGIEKTVGIMGLSSDVVVVVTIGGGRDSISYTPG